MLADGQTDTRTHRQTQTDFIICPMLYATAMGQITREHRRTICYRLQSHTRAIFLANKIVRRRWQTVYVYSRVTWPESDCSGGDSEVQQLVDCSQPGVLRRVWPWLPHISKLFYWLRLTTLAVCTAYVNIINGSGLSNHTLDYVGLSWICLLHSPRRLCFNRRLFVRPSDCLSVCEQLHFKTTDQIFMISLPVVYLRTSASGSGSRSPIFKKS